jgi:hypothetical protein
MATTPKKQPVLTSKKSAEKSTADFALNKQNYKLIAIGFGAMVLGYILMIGGGSDSPEAFNGDELFSFRRITLSTLFIVGGILFVIYAIMKKPKTEKEA